MDKDAVFLRSLANDRTLLEIGRKAVEDVLFEWRNKRISEPFRGNGLVIREANGKESSIIRFGPETALRIGLLTIADYIAKQKETP